MTFYNAKRLYRAILFAARDSGRRFVLNRRAASSRRVGCRPLVLRWRQQQKNRTGPTTRHAARSTNILVSPRFQFYFANYRIDQGPSPTDARAKESIKIVKTRFATNHIYVGASHRGTKPPATSPAHQSRFAPGRMTGARERTRDRSSSKDAAARSAPNPFADLPRHTRRNRLSRFTIGPVQPVLRNETARTLGTRKISLSWPSVFADQSQRQTNYPPLTLPRAQRRSDRPSKNAITKKIAAAQYGTEELIWRRITKTVTEGDQRTQWSGSVDPSSGTPSSSKPIEQELIEVKREVEASAAKSVTTLDPALVDRLADDVIRKVERRVRIERERRGIS